jgi:glycosyltransferase involved in cell wall biosynthesis
VRTTTVRVVIVSRVFAPEVSPASWLLRAVATELAGRGCDVTVLTARPPRGAVIDDPRGVRVRRFRVRRDRQQYVRGYLSYLSFDVPLALRLLLSRKADLYLVEPPPTTTAAVLVGARGAPVMVDAADLWSDAARIVTSSRLVLGALRRVELWGLRRAAHLLAAHEPLLIRLREVGVETPATVIGFGADTRVFRYRGEPIADPPLFVYPGTHSEWHGAGIFVEAFPAVLARHPLARMLFIGNGADREAMRERARELGIGGAVEFRPPTPPAELAPILASATAALASVKTGLGYDYAFATKAYSAFAAGCPLIFAGTGPTVDFLADPRRAGAGIAEPYEADALAAAMNAAADSPRPPEERDELSQRAGSEHSLEAVARLVADASLALASHVDSSRSFHSGETS